MDNLCSVVGLVFAHYPGPTGPALVTTLFREAATERMIGGGDGSRTGSNYATCCLDLQDHSFDRRWD